MFDFFKITVFFVFTALTLQSARLSAQDSFGRFFTTPKQREQLDMKRMKGPEQELVVKVDEAELGEEKSEKKTAPIGSVQLKGLVYRSDGKSTAWTGKGPSYEGNISDQYLDINPENIDPDKVVIEIPTNNIKVELKAGQTYSPDTGQVDDPESAD